MNTLLDRQARAAKTLVGFLLLVPAASPAWGQASFESEPDRHGGFGGPVLKVSSINGEGALLFGLHGGWIINLDARHRVILGAGAYGVVNDVPAQNVTLDGAPVNLGVDYGGLEVAYAYRFVRPMYVSVQTLVGAGGVGYRDVDDDGKTRGGFFVAEPGLFLRFSVTTFLRLGGGVSYRYVRGARLAGAASDDLSDVSGVVMLEVGSF